MARPILKVSNYRPDQIKAMFRNDERYTIGIRLYAVYQVALGQPSRKLEELYNTSFKQITNWVHRFEREGIEGLKDKEGRGRTVLLWNWIRNSIRNGTYQETSSSPIKDWHSKSGMAFVNSTCAGVGHECGIGRTLIL